jgi:hypothetical protein
MRVPSVKLRVKVGCTSVTSFATCTGFGAGDISLTGVSSELRVIVKVFIKASSKINYTRMTVVLSAFLIPWRAIPKLLRNLGLASFGCPEK